MNSEYGKDGRSFDGKIRLKRSRASDDGDSEGEGSSSDEESGKRVNKDACHTISESGRHDCSESCSPTESVLRKQRLEKNRKKARDQRNRKKVMLQEMQRNVVAVSRMNDDLRRKNRDLTKRLAQYGQIVSCPSQLPNLSQGALLRAMLLQQSTTVETGNSSADLYRMATGTCQQQVQIPQAGGGREVESSTARNTMLLNQGILPVANSSMEFLPRPCNNSAFFPNTPAAFSNEIAILRHFGQQQQRWHRATTNQNRLQQGPSALTSTGLMPPTILPPPICFDTNNRSVHNALHHHHDDDRTVVRGGAPPAAGTGVQRLTTETKMKKSDTSTVLSPSQETSKMYK
uniref:BZIP domain-containing protein n=1 Tax=Ditylum brightwellii TaxID=49249 RepID=A0A6U3S027_9STRA|mmetsp:Transcript_32019/g.47790  ORF Transcript_32019/g.47790 Transcript_32019/m.47790 type:complete len:345 (+) Transcript_32019:160-1194(+)